MIDCVETFLFDATLSSSVFLSLVMLAVLGCRQPARRILIARVALVSSLGMIPLVALEPLPRLDLVHALVNSELIPLALLRPSASIQIEAGREQDPGEARRSEERRPVAMAGSGEASYRWLERGVAVVDLVFVGAGFAWLLLGFGGVHWLIGRSHDPSRATQRYYEGLLAELLPGGPRCLLRVSSRVQHPVVAGILRPTILIPAWLDESGEERESLRLSLLHELAHVERFDHWFGMAASLAQTVWFFLPQVWWIRSQLLIDQEFLADRSAALRYGSSFGYAASLLSMAAPAGARTDDPGREVRSTGPTIGKIGIPSPLFQRVLMLLHCPFAIEARIPRLWSWTSKILLMGVFLVAACLLIRWPDAAAVEQRLRPTARSTGEIFRIAHFVAEPQIVAPGGPSFSFILPLVLPPAFDLKVEIRCDSGDFTSIRLAGYPLGARRSRSVGAFAQPPAETSPDPTWHRVHLRRDRHGLALEIDGRDTSLGPGFALPSDWLTIEPGPHEAAEFRNLVVSW